MRKKYKQVNAWQVPVTQKHSALNGGFSKIISYQFIVLEKPMFNAHIQSWVTSIFLASFPGDVSPLLQLTPGNPGLLLVLWTQGQFPGSCSNSIRCNTWELPFKGEQVMEFPNYLCHNLFFHDYFYFVGLLPIFWHDTKN